jgi:putative chitinase
MIDDKGLHYIMPYVDSAWLVPLNAAMVEYGIGNTGQRQAMFLAQVGQETAGLTQLEENLNYGAGRLVEVWPHHFNDHTALTYAHNPMRLANCIYANRNGNGNEASGDGWRYRGRGPLMDTGRVAYADADKHVQAGILLSPDLLAHDKIIGARSAGWAWAVRLCNQLADAGQFLKITQRIQGGNEGEAGREAYLVRARHVFV